MFRSPPFWNCGSYMIKNFGIEVTFNGITSVLNFIKIFQLVQRLMEGGGGQTHRMVISFTYISLLERKVPVS
jgi:hypothetical protein